MTLIWKASEWPHGQATTTGLADRLGVTPSTVSANLKKLTRDGLITYRPYGPIRLTEAGEALAVTVVRRHRLIETYLVNCLGLRWDQVHHEADLLEHAVSDLVLARMDEALGHPERDPHGDPIPQPDGTVPPTEAAPLTALPPGKSARVMRVSDRHPEVLRYLSTLNITVGTPITVLEHLPAAGIVRITTPTGTADISSTAAHDIRAEILPPSADPT